ncbi:MAG: hypothetical protein ACKVX9_10245 [Blastocatellia bacterium]
MNFDTGQRERLIKYLLGRLSEAEREEVERTCLSNPLLTEEIWEIWDELTDAFLHHELSEGDQIRIARRIESSPYLRERLAENRAFLSAVNKAASRKRSGASPSSGVQNRTGSQFPGMRAGRRLWLPLLAAIIILVVVVRVFLPEPADQTDPAPSTPSTGISSADFVLPYNPGADGEALPRQRLAFQSSIRTIQLQVELPFAESTQYLATLTDSGGFIVKSWDRLPSRAYNSNPWLPLQLSVEEIPDGNYELTVMPLAGPNSSAPPIIYPIRLERLPGP